MTAPATSHKLGAELLGTFWLVLGGVGTAVLAGGDQGAGTLEASRWPSG